MIKFYYYDKCSTCKKAEKYFILQNIIFEKISIKENPPSDKQILTWLNQENFTIKNLFNTSGLKYRELNLKNKINNSIKEEAAKLLASDGMLIKHPLIVKDKKLILVGFRENEYKNIL